MLFKEILEIIFDSGFNRHCLGYWYFFAASIGFVEITYIERLKFWDLV
jgi:hypothetical protein